ncbi:MAG: hypothetical protein JJU40_07500 [Rhodobacteraceae bacterium]|nr:hypothetical protein [Paracoccaceae bacterium]
MTDLNTLFKANLNARLATPLAASAPPSVIERTLPSMRLVKIQVIVVAPTTRRMPRASGSLLIEGSK